MIQFTVFGTPVGKGRPKFSTFNGHAMAHTPQKTVNYENLVKLSYQHEYGGQIIEKDIPLRVEIDAFFPTPKATSKKRYNMMLEGKIRHTKKCDADNLAKAICDALNGIAYYDDSQVCELLVRKYYGPSPCVTVRIMEVE